MKYLDLTGLAYFWSKIKALLSNKQDVLSFDNTPTSGSTNPVTSGGIHSYYNNKEKVIAAALNDLEARKLNVSDIGTDEVPTKNSTNFVTSGGIYNVITENEEIVASAINDLNDKKADISSLSPVATSGSYNDLTDKPEISSAVTEQTVSDWGFTKNSGTVNSITINATSPITIDNSAAITTSGTRTISHGNSGVSAGTYKSVTVDAKGHVTGGTNPTTLSGYGITDALNTSSTAQTKAGNLTAAKFITNGGTSSQVVRGDGSLVNSKQLPQYEAYLEWGGKNFSASYGPIDAAMVSELGAPRTMFAKAAGIVVEYSTDGGSTWVDYGATNEQKVALFSTGYNFYTGKNSTAGGASINNMLRVSLYTSAASIYTSLNKFVIYVSTNGSSGCYCTIRCRTQQNYEDNVDTWVTITEQASILGWSGYNVINTSAITTYGNVKASHYGELQFIFGCTGISSTGYSGLTIQKIFGFGGVGWTTPSNMAKTGHLYSFDANQNATFPSQVTATSFKRINGTSSQFLKADGSVDSNTYLTSHQQLKTINNESLIGTGNITIQGGGGSGETNVIETIKVNGTALTPDSNKAVDITVPSAVTESTVSGWGFTKNTGIVSSLSDLGITATATELNYTDGVTSNIQTQLNTKGTYSKPSGGIPKTDLTSAVQTSLEKADTALQSYTETDPTVPAWAKAANKPTYTASEVGALPASTVIPAAPGTLNTTATTAQSTNSSEALSGNITLHKVAKTGTYNDLIGKPTIPSEVTESTVSGWGFTKNTGTYSKPSGGIPASDLAAGVIPTVPTNVSAFTNDAGYLTSVNAVTIYSGSTSPSSSLGNNGDIYIQTS